MANLHLHKDKNGTVWVKYGNKFGEGFDPEGLTQREIRDRIKFGAYLAGATPPSGKLLTDLTLQVMRDG